MKPYDPLDMANDANMSQYFMGLFLFAGFCAKYELGLDEMVQGSITGFCFVIASTCSTFAYISGPAGVIMALMCT